MFLSNGFNGFISKPIVMQELDTILKEWLSPEKVASVSETPRAESETTDAAVDANFIKAVKKIAEINAEIGLNRFSHMHDMYRSTLDMFYRKITAECDNMTAFLESKELDSFMIAIHAMKSSLATIGAMQLSETAFKLETASKKNDVKYCTRNFPDFKKKLLSLHKKLSIVFPDVKTSLRKEPGDAGFLRENAQKALAATEDFDNDTAIGILKNLLLFEFGDENNALLEDALAALDNFEHESAVEILRKLE